MLVTYVISMFWWSVSCLVETSVSWVSCSGLNSFLKGKIQSGRSGSISESLDWAGERGSSVFKENRPKELEWTLGRVRPCRLGLQLIESLNPHTTSGVTLPCSDYKLSRDRY